MRMKHRLAVLLAAGALLVLAFVGSMYWQSAHAEGQTKAAPGRYTVIETHGHNLLVTDNQENKLYFYATDRDAAVGSPLKLRASLDLTQVGKEELKITAHNLEKVETRDK
jgi:hypothetical protein